jgi:hypothetical protein
MRRAAEKALKYDDRDNSPEDKRHGGAEKKPKGETYIMLDENGEEIEVNEEELQKLREAGYEFDMDFDTEEKDHKDMLDKITSEIDQIDKADKLYDPSKPQ